MFEYLTIDKYLGEQREACLYCRSLVGENEIARLIAAIEPSVITAKAAINDHFKTGH